MLASQQMQFFTFADRAEQSMRLLRSMNPKTSQKIGHSGKARVCSDKTQQQIPVHREVKGGIDTSDFLVDRASPEKRFLRHIIEMTYGLGIVPRQDPASNFGAILIDDDAMSIKDVNFWVCRKVPADEGESAGHK